MQSLLLGPKPATQLRPYENNSRLFCDTIFARIKKYHRYFRLHSTIDAELFVRLA